jgi:purine-binding chemotaxis protein CheW
MELQQGHTVQGLLETDHQSAGTNASRMCLITLGGELFALDLGHVSEVFEVDSITPVPGAPSTLVGVANLRGTVIPLADLRPSLGLSATDSSSSLKYAVVVRHGGQQIGILVDTVPEIRTVRQDEFLAAPAQGTANGPVLVSALLRVEERMSGVVEVPRLLTSVGLG